MDIDKLINDAKNSYKTNKYRSYRECYEGGVNTLGDILRQQNLHQCNLSGSMLSDRQCMEIAEKFKEYCLMMPDDSIFIGSKAIPLIFDECLNMLKNKKVK